MREGVSEGVARKRRRVAADSAAGRLVSLLGAFPVLAGELPDLLRSLEAGEVVDVEALPDAELRDKLSGFLAALEEVERMGGDGDTRLRFRLVDCGGVPRQQLIASVKALMDEAGLARPPPPMCSIELYNSAALCASRMADQHGMQEIWAELPPVLDRVLSREIVVLEGLPEEVHNHMRQLLMRLGLKDRSQDGTIGLGLSDGDDEEESAPAKAVKQLRSKCVQMSSRDTEGESEGEGPRSQQTRAIGPARPDPSQLQEAAAAAVLQNERDKECGGELSDDSDDVIGPSLVEKGVRGTPSAPCQETYRLSDAQLAVEAAKKKLDWNEGTGDTVDTGVAREEWMLVPPKSLGILGSIKTLQPTARKFQERSERAKRAAEQERQSLQQKSEAQIKAEAEMEKMRAAHREARGPSLVEKHAQKTKEEKRRQQLESAGMRGAKKWSWNRDADFEQRKKINERDYKEMVASSKDLDSKFTREVSRSFM